MARLSSPSFFLAAAASSSVLVLRRCLAMLSESLLSLSMRLCRSLTDSSWLYRSSVLADFWLLAMNRISLRLTGFVSLVVYRAARSMLVAWMGWLLVEL